MKWKLIILIICACLWEACSSNNEIKTVEYSYAVETTIVSLDDRNLIYLTDRPKDNQQVPVVIIIDGSGCTGLQRPGFSDLYNPGDKSPKPYARVRIEKPGVLHDANRDSACSENFLKHYTMDQRVIDHLRVLQHLKKTADWWNGELYVWGWSDGGDIAVQLTAYYPNVTRAVLGAMGGGFTMAQHYTDFWVCPNSMEGSERDICVSELEIQFTRMNNNPTWTKTWSGKANTWKVWASRLNARHSNLLRDNTVPVLIVHGEKDFNNTPVESARRLVQDLKDANNTVFTYWEIPNMEHGWQSLPVEEGKKLENDMLNWLLGI